MSGFRLDIPKIDAAMTPEEMRAERDAKLRELQEATNALLEASARESDKGTKRLHEDERARAERFRDRQIEAGADAAMAERHYAAQMASLRARERQAEEAAEEIRRAREESSERMRQLLGGLRGPL